METHLKLWKMPATWDMYSAQMEKHGIQWYIEQELDGTNSKSYLVFYVEGGYLK